MRKSALGATRIPPAEMQILEVTDEGWRSPLARIVHAAAGVAAEALRQMARGSLEIPLRAAVALPLPTSRQQPTLETADFRR